MVGEPESASTNLDQDCGPGIGHPHSRTGLREAVARTLLCWTGKASPLRSRRCCVESSLRLGSWILLSRVSGLWWKGGALLTRAISLAREKKNRMFVRKRIDDKSQDSQKSP